MTENQHITLQLSIAAVNVVAWAADWPVSKALYLAWLAYWGVSMWKHWGIYDIYEREP